MTPLQYQISAKLQSKLQHQEQRRFSCRCFQKCPVFLKFKKNQNFCPTTMAHNSKTVRFQVSALKAARRKYVFLPRTGSFSCSGVVDPELLAAKKEEKNFCPFLRPHNSKTVRFQVSASKSGVQRLLFPTQNGQFELLRSPRSKDIRRQK